MSSAEIFVMFLPDVYPSSIRDYDRMIKNLIDEEDDDTSKQPEVYDAIPKKFQGLTSWPNTIKLKCWWCSRMIKARPWSIPDGEMGNVIGVFCSCCCASGWIDTQERTNQWKLRENLRIMFKIFNGFKPKSIPSAPDKIQMIDYGGNRTEMAYQEKINELEASIEPVDTMSKLPDAYEDSYDVH